MKKSLLSLAILAAVCPAAAFAADSAEQIHTIVWSGSGTAAPDLNQTFNYTGAQLAGATSNSWFDVVEIKDSAAGLVENASLTVSAKTPNSTSGADKQIEVLDVSGGANVKFGGSSFDISLDTDLIGTGNNMATGLMVWDATTVVSADVSNFSVKSTAANGKSVYGLTVNNNAANLSLTGNTVNVLVESATERTSEDQYSEALGLDIAKGTLSSSAGTTLNIKGRSTSQHSSQVSTKEGGANYTGATPLSGIKFEGGQGQFEGDVSIDVASNAGLVHGIWASNYFYNTTSGSTYGSSSGTFNNLNIKAASDSGDAYGIHASYTPEDDKTYDVILKVGGDLNIATESKSGNAYGVSLSGKSDALFSGNVNIGASAGEGKNAYAIHIEDSSLTLTGERVALEGDVLVKNKEQVAVPALIAASEISAATPATTGLIFKGNREVTINGDVRIETTGTGLTLDNTNVKMTGDSTLAATTLSSNNSTLYVADNATANVDHLTTTGHTSIVVDHTDNGVNFGSVTKTEGAAITTVGSSKFNDQYASSEEAAKAVLGVVTTGTGSDKTVAADKVAVEQSEKNGSFSADVKADGSIDQSTVVKTLNTKTERIGKTVARNIYAWRLEMNDMNKRLGELRDSEGNTGVWARVNAGKQKDDDGKNDFTQLQFGADTKIEALADIHAGVAFSYTDSDLSYNGGEGDNKVFGLAAYGSWLGDNGSFVDVIARVARLESNSVIDGTAADFNTTAYSLSAEIGHRFNLAETVFLEPQAEMNWGYVDGKTFATVNKTTGIAADTTVDSTTSLIGRLGVRAGITCPNNKGTAYVRTSVLHEFDGDVSVSRGDGSYTDDAGDTWFEYAVGGNYNLTPSTQFYADLSRTSGAELSEPWRFNVGARWAF